MKWHKFPEEMIPLNKMVLILYKDRDDNRQDVMCFPVKIKRANEYYKVTTQTGCSEIRDFFTMENIVFWAHINIPKNEKLDQYEIFINIEDVNKYPLIVHSHFPAKDNRSNHE